MTRRNVRPLFVSCLASFLLSTGCFLVIGEIPEGSDPPGSGGNSGASAADGGVDGEAGSVGGSAGSGCVKAPCDCDGDGHDRSDCGGDDCEDADPLVFTGQSGWFTAANKVGSFDYNCDGFPTKEFGFTDCGGLKVLGACNDAAPGYYDSTVPCGEPATFGGCTWTGLACEQNLSQTITVRCH